MLQFNISGLFVSFPAFMEQLYRIVDIKQYQMLADILLIGSGIFVTLQLLLGSIIIGLIVGIILAILRQGSAYFVIDRIISVLRGTPLILQLSFVYFSLPNILGFNMDVISAGILTFGLNSSAYVAEILRSGIENLPKGQFEAAKTLQIPCFYMWKDIILPQVIRNILPALVNELIALLKETAIISIVGGMDLMRTAQSVAAQKFTYFMPLCIAGFYYYALVLLIEYMGKKIDHYMNNYASN